MKKQLIVTAHDFGLCDSVNQGILYSLNHPNTFVTELALLPNAPGSLQASELAKKTKTSVSLNLNFTTFKPLAKNVKSLIDKDGNFSKVDVRSWNFSTIDTFDDEEIRTEIDAQWDWFIQHVSKKPSAILTRKNEFGDPKFLIPICEKAKKEQVAVRAPFWEWKANYGAQSYVEQENITSTSDVFIGVRDWIGRFGFDLKDDFDKINHSVDNAKGVSELILFIGFVEKDLFETSSINWQRGEFIKLLDDTELMNKFKETFELKSYRDLIK